MKRTLLFKRASGKQTLVKRFRRLSPRRRIAYLAGIPMSLLAMWSLLAAMSAPSIEAEISRNVESLRAMYSDPLYSLPQAIGVDKDMERGNLDAATNDLAIAHLRKHAELAEDLLSSYKQDLLLSSEVEKMRATAEREIASGGPLPVDKIGDIDHEACVQSGLTRQDCIFVRYMGDGLSRMQEAHQKRDYAQFIDGERVYLTALAALGNFSAGTPDFEAARLTLKTYRSAVNDTLTLNRMWIGEGEPIAVPATVTPQGIETRIEKTLGE